MAGGWQPLISVGDAIECMVATLGTPGAEILLMSTVQDGNVGPGESFALDSQNLPDAPADKVFELAIRLGVKGLLFGSRSHGCEEAINPLDAALTRWLVVEAWRRDLCVVEHVVVHDNMFRLMRESLASLN